VHQKFTATLEWPPNTKKFTLHITAQKLNRNLMINIPLSDETAATLADSALLEELRTPTTPTRSCSITDCLTNFFAGLFYILWRLTFYKGETPPKEVDERAPLRKPALSKTFTDAPHLLPLMGAVRAIRGLQNEGSTCFINSIIQALMQLSPEARDAIIQAHETKIARDQREIQKASWIQYYFDENYQSLYYSMKGSEALITMLRNYHSPTSVSLYAVRGLIGRDSLREGYQEDAYELLDKIFEPLDGMTNPDLYHLLAEEKEFVPYHPKTEKEAVELAEKLANKNGSSPLPTEFARQPNSALRLPLPNNRVNLQTVLNQEFEMRPLSEQDEPGTYMNDDGQIGWYGVSQKRQVIETTGKDPEHIVLQLKRFRNDGTKIHTAVILPSNNKLTLRINKQPVSYDIQTLVLHRGQTLNSGHYLDYVKKEEGWYEANDSDIKSIELPPSTEREVYMIFLKKSTNPLA
ncbi:MAG TPA: hypothetical protein VMR37_05515, partial [Rhabdochlamydiaceae bacterium]|nr:hypothetical protein [Rhabdochlamydiaceae bacterium]